MRRISEGAKLTIRWLQREPSGSLVSFPEESFLFDESVAEYFKSGQATIISAETSGSAARAEDILLHDYIGDRKDGSGIRWIISEETYLSWIADG
jgi:hypothetical protein